MEFCDKLKELRAEKGISQTTLAADIHISRSAVAKWENGLGLPNDESLKLLSEYFGVSNVCCAISSACSGFLVRAAA